MKYFLLFLCASTRLFAQWTVFDPANHAVNVAIRADERANHLEVLRQWADDLEKLNAQLQELRAQLEVQRRIRDVIGEPAQVGRDLRIENLATAEISRVFGETGEALRKLVNAANSLRTTAGGIYESLDDRTTLNQPFARQTAPYQRYALVEKHADNLATVFAATAAPLASLDRDLTETTRQLKSAGTQAEVDKLQGTISLLLGRVTGIETQRRDAALQLEAQQILNENQAAKERQDLLEKQIAEEGQTYARLGAWQESLRISPVTLTR